MRPVDEEKVQQIIKHHLDNYVKNCLQRSYNSGKLGYVTLVGGSALNHYLSGYEEIVTSDYDLKFVVMPQFTEDEADLRRANVKRLYLAKDLTNCLKSSPDPKEIRIHPQLIVRVGNVPVPIKIEGSKIIITDPKTGQERPFLYRFNKIFTIRLAYQFTDPNKRLRTAEERSSSSKNKSHSKNKSSSKHRSNSKSHSKSKSKGGSQPTYDQSPHDSTQLPEKFDQTRPIYYYDFVDVGLFYRMTDTEPFYNFMTRQMYDTMLKEPFNQRIPIPFEVHQGIRYPVPPYLLMDNFRMLHFAQDFLAVYKDDPARIQHFKKKIKGYQRKMNIILDYLQNQEGHTKSQINKIAEEIKKSLHLYEPLAMTNSICYREEGKINYTMNYQEDKKECTPEYLEKLKEFYNQYHQALKAINQLMPHYRPGKKVNQHFSSSKSKKDDEED